LKSEFGTSKLLKIAVVQYNISERVDATELVEQCTASQREAGQSCFFDRLLASMMISVLSIVYLSELF